MTAKLKVVETAARLSSRSALAAAIERKAEADRALAENAGRVEDLMRRAWLADEAIEVAARTADEVKALTVRRLADPSAPAPAMSAREARLALDDAREEAVMLRAAAQTAREARGALETSAVIARASLKDAIAAVVMEAPTTRGLLANYRSILADMASLRKALYLLDALRAIPDDFRNWGQEPPADPSIAEAWGAALDALVRDADAPLPPL